MSACLMVGAVALALASDGFRLEWSHSVEHLAWREDWRVVDGALRLDRAAVRGSGAGMEPGPDAMLEDGWWIWRPDLPPQPHLLLAASGATDGGWHLCAGADCRVLGAHAGQPIDLRPCPP